MTSGKEALILIMAKILITGGAGFIGKDLAYKLSKENHDITLADNFLRGRKDEKLELLLKLPNIKLIEADLTDKESWDKIGGGYDYVYHLVSINGFKQFLEIPQEVLRVGMTTTMNALEWFREKNRRPSAKILYTSSNEVYIGAIEAFGTLPLPTPENVPVIIADTYNPRWSYAGQKLICELFFIHYAKAYNLRMVIVRPHYIYGPGAGYDAMIPKIIERVKNRIEPFPIIGGDDSRSYCYIDDATEGIISAMESTKTDGGTYNIGSSEEVTIKNLIEKIFKIMDWTPKKTEIKDSPDGKISRFLPDVSKIKRDTGWEAKIKFEEGLKKTVDWYLENPK